MEWKAQSKKKPIHRAFDISILNVLSDVEQTDLLTSSRHCEVKLSEFLKRNLASSPFYPRSLLSTLVLRLMLTLASEIFKGVLPLA